MAAHNNNRGFTLIELMIVVGIILIITGAIVPSLTSYMRNQTVRQAQQQLISDMRSTQVRALTGAMSDIEFDSERIKYWGIAFNGNTYDTFITHENSCVFTNYPGQHQETETLPSDISVKTAPNCLLFDMRNGDIVDPAGSFNESHLVVGYASDGGSDQQVEYNRMGLIYASD